MPNENTSPDGYTLFTISDSATLETLATLPLTLSISATIDAFEKAGYQVKWHWA